MISNYIKLAWRILGRKKFFTFISLFGISFTLGILMVILSFLQSELGTDKPLTYKNDFVYLNTLSLKTDFFDTIVSIDTTFLNDEMVLDSSFEIKGTGSMNWNSELNNGIAEEYLSDLESAEEVSIFIPSSEHDVYVNGVKQTFSALYGDPSYWNIIDHQMLEGRVFDQKEMDAVAKVLVVSDKSAENYFGTKEGVLGKEMFIDGTNYKVIGMYAHTGKIMPYVSPDIVIPYTNANLDNQDSFYHGFFNVLYKKKKGVSADKLKEEIVYAATRIPMDHPSKPEGYEDIVFRPNTYDEDYAQAIYYEREASKSYSIMKWIIISLIAFFVILPTLNLINLNVSRIMDRSSEIGVRKAFGAHRGNIISQFIIENIVQTILGGLIGFGLALALINMINKGGYLMNARLELSPKFFMYSFLVTILFGILSGLLPAYKMSKLQIVNALKENKL